MYNCKQTMQNRIISTCKTLFFALLVLFMTTPTFDATASIPDVDSRLSHARDMVERCRWGEARAVLDELYATLNPQLNPVEYEWVDFSRACCAVELGVDDADRILEDYLRRNPQSLYRNRVLYYQGIMKVESGDFDAAEQALLAVDDRALSSRERDRYYIYLGCIEFEREEYVQAGAYLDKVSVGSNYYDHALYLKSYIAYRNGDNATAREGFTELEDHAQYGYIIPFYLLQLEYIEGNHDSVIARGERLLRFAEGASRNSIVRIVAESLFYKEDYARVVHLLSEFPEAEMGPQDRYVYGYSLYRMTMYEEACRHLEVASLESGALGQNAAYHLGCCFIKLENLSDAARAFSLASDGDMSSEIAEDALFNYGYLMYRLDDGIFNQTIAVLQRYITLFPDSENVDEAKRLLITAYYNSESYQEAYQTIREFPNPDTEMRTIQQRAALQCAIEAAKNRDWESADRLLAEIEEIGVQSTYLTLARYWQGEVAYNMGDMGRAIEKFGEYIYRAPRTAVERLYAYYGTGYAQFTEGNNDAALEAFEAFVRGYTTRDEYLYDAQNRIGDVYFSEREFTDARNAYNIAMASNFEPRHYARYQLAMIDGIEDRVSSKVERLNDIVSDGAGDYVDDAWYELGRTYITSERYSEGAATLQQFVDLNDTISPFYVSALSDLALAYYNLERRDDARRCYEAVVSYNAQSPAAMEAMRGIREIYIDEDRLDEYFAYAERSGVQGDMSAAMRDSLTFAAARRSYLEGDMENARNKFINYLDSFERGYNRAEALFYLSDCYVEAEDNDAALETMEELLAQGYTQYTERVLGVYARMTYDMERFDTSADAYLELYEVAHDSSRRRAATEGYVDATISHGDAARIKRMAENVATMTDATEWARTHSMLAHANVLANEGNHAAAKPLYETLAADRTTVEGAEAYYRLLKYKYDEGDYAAAEQMIYDMGECGSLYWQAKMFLLLGDVMVATGNTFQARATYQSIIDGYTRNGDGILDEARERIDGLAR